MLSKHAFDPQCLTHFQMNLIFNARIFWRRLTIWTVNYILSRYEGLGTQEEAFGHLYLEFLDFGDTLQIFFGREITNEYTDLVNEYAYGWRDLLSAQLQGDVESVRQNVDRLYQNTADSAAFLASVNPYLDEAVWRGLLETYLRYTIEQANSFMTGEFSVEVSDRLTDLTNKMGDIFAESLYDYIISSFQYVPKPEDRLQCITYEQMDQIYRIRMFWFELILWVRAYMISRLRGIGKTDEVYARLRQVSLDFVDNLEKFFGTHPAEGALLEHLNTYIDLTADMITAQKEGDQAEIDRLARLLYQNANQRAAAITSINPFWSEAEWRTRLYDLLRNTIDESSSILAGDYSRNLDIFNTLMDLAENASGYFAQGLVYYLFQSKQ
jgi:hypothetical protein